jgi:hypothetical protein
VNNNNFSADHCPRRLRWPNFPTEESAPIGLFWAKETIIQIGQKPRGQNRHIRPIVSSGESKIHRLSFVKTFHFLLISLASTYGVTVRNFDSVCEWGGLGFETQLAMPLRISIELWMRSAVESSIFLHRFKSPRQGRFHDDA